MIKALPTKRNIMKKNYSRCNFAAQKHENLREKIQNVFNFRFQSVK